MYLNVFRIIFQIKWVGWLPTEFNVSHKARSQCHHFPVLSEQVFCVIVIEFYRTVVSYWSIFLDSLEVSTFKGIFINMPHFCFGLVFFAIAIHMQKQYFVLCYQYSCIITVTIEEASYQVRVFIQFKRVCKSTRVIKRAALKLLANKGYQQFTTTQASSSF